MVPAELQLGGVASMRLLATRAHVPTSHLMFAHVSSCSLIATQITHLGSLLRNMAHREFAHQGC